MLRASASGIAVGIAVLMIPTAAAQADTEQVSIAALGVTYCIEGSKETALADGWELIEPGDNDVVDSAREEYFKYRANQIDVGFSMFSHAERPDTFLMYTQGTVPNLMTSSSCAVSNSTLTEIDDFEVISTALGAGPTFAGKTGPYKLHYIWQPGGLDARLITQYHVFDEAFEKSSGVEFGHARIETPSAH